MKIAMTQRLLERYPSARFVGILVKGINNQKSNKELEIEKSKVAKFITQNIDKFSEKVEDRGKFFREFKKSFPIEYQLKTIAEGQKIPTHSVIKDLFFITELKNCMIMSAQDASKLHEPLMLDLAEGGEDFIYMDGKAMKSKKDDILLKQGEEVLISHLYGAGKSTLVDENTKDVLFMIWSDISLEDEDIEKAVLDLTNYCSMVFDKPKLEVFEIAEESDSFVVTPWEVKGDVDYKKLIRKFGTTPISDKLLERLERHTGELHHYLTRKKFFSHRDFDKILEAVEKKQEFALYTGRGPSGNTTLGHIVPWIFTRWLQEKFNAELYFEITDVEKYLVKDLTMEQTRKWAYENIYDIIAVGFDPDKTFIFLDSEYGKTQFKLANMLAKKVTFSTVKAVFGFDNETNIGLIFHPAVQATPCYLPTYLKGKQIPVLIPAAIDQDNYWRMTRDLAPKFNFPKPCQIHCSFLPGLGEGGKMSASDPSSAIYTTDDEKTVRKKIMKYAFSGGRDTIEEHRKYGGNPDIDKAYQYLTFFEPDDKRLEKIYNDYKTGKLLSGELKQICADTINGFLREHQKKREWAKKNIEKFMLRD